VQLKDPDISSYGAEALPAGLREINAQRHSEAPAPERPEAPAPQTPLLGLLALARLWLRRR